MQRNLRLRARVNAAIRGAMDRQGFCEVETPLLWAPTPEGSREFSVPSRLHHGSFYALPQSPQLAKQLLMVGGFDRYYQIARCLRDEDLRADRQFEFSQLDMELSFGTQDDVMAYVSEAVLDAAEAATGERPPPIARMTWSDALERYGTDKPDLRFGMELVDLAVEFAHTEVRAFSGSHLKAMCVPGGGSFTRSRLDALAEQAKRAGAAGLAWFRVVAGDGGSRAHLRFAAQPLPVGDRAGGTPGEDRCARRGTSSWPSRTPTGSPARRWARCAVALGSPPVGQGPHRYVWVVDFPMFDGVDAAGNPQPAHHPFTMPYEEDLPLLDTVPFAVRSQAYDLVLNGWELGSGSVRIHRRDIQSRIFDTLGISAEEAESRFGFLLNAFRYGAPPHAGFAFGIDRLVAVLAGEENIREVIAYPKTQSGADLLTGAPERPACRHPWPSWGSAPWPRPPHPVLRRLESVRRGRPPEPGAPGASCRTPAAAHAGRNGGPGASGRLPAPRCARWPRATGSDPPSCGALRGRARPPWPVFWRPPRPSTWSRSRRPQPA